MVKVQVVSATQADKIPTSIVLNMGYYQMNSKDKKLVTASVEFSGFISPNDFNEKVYNYTLSINYQPLSHTDLMIAFALPWYVYFTMYILVGVLSVVMAAMFALYHKLITRVKKTSVFFMGYLRHYLPAPILGFVLVSFPILLYTLIISVLFALHLMQFQFSSLWCDAKDQTCSDYIFWNSMTVNPDMTEAEKWLMHRSRLGYVMIHCGLWIMWRTSLLMTLRPTSEEQRGIFVSYNKNVWYVTAWKRMSYFVFNLITIFVELTFVHISFSNIFSKNLWYFIIAFKVIGIALENTCELLLTDNLMLSPISTTIDLMENLVTFGATDFLQFISSFVLGLGVQMAERAYTEPLIDVIVDYGLDNRHRFLSYISKIVGDNKVEEEDADEVGGEPEPAEEEKANDHQNQAEEVDDENADKKEPRDEISHVDSQGSDILLTENSAEHDLGDIFGRQFRSGAGFDGESDEDEQSFLADANNRKLPVKSRVETIMLEVDKKIQGNRYFGLKDDFEENFKLKYAELENMKGVKKQEEEKDKEEDEGNKDNQDADGDIETYYNYCVRTNSMLYLPVVCLIIWQFYKETAFSVKWSIKEKDFLFYFLFSVMIVPFMIIIDILFYNLMTYLHNYNYLGSLMKWNKGNPCFTSECKSAKKTHYWLGFRSQKMSLDAKLRPLNQFGFSSQFYFMTLLGIAGNMFVIIGSMMIMETNTNAYMDVYILVVLLVNQLILLLVEKVSLFFRKLFKIWEISQTQAGAAGESKLFDHLAKAVSPVQEIKKTQKQNTLEEASDFKKGDE